MNTKTIFIIILVASAIFLGYKMTNKKNDLAESQNLESAEALQNLNTTQESADTVTDIDESDSLVTKSIAVNESSLNWTANKTILTEWIDKGSVKISSGSAKLNGNTLVSAEATVDMNSISAITTGAGGNQDKLSTHLKSADFFDAVKYPTSKIVIKSVLNNEANADITIKGVTKNLKFPVSVSESGDNIKVMGKITINRADFGVKYGSTSFFKDLADRAIVSDIFTVDFSIILK